jgi:flagellar protein FlaF
MRESRKPVEYEEEQLEMHYANRAYAKTAIEMASPRELEARLLLQAAAKLQAVYDSWRDKPTGLHEAVMYNRKLWTVLLDAVMSEDNRLPSLARDNLRRLGVYIMAQTFSLMTNPQPEHLESIIKINRGIAAGLRSKA